MKISKYRKHLRQDASQIPDGTSVLMRSSIVILMLVSLHSIFYVFTCAVFCTYAMTTIIGGIINQDFANFLLATGRCAIVLWILFTKFWNMFLYMFRVPYFGKAVKKIIMCNCFQKN